jgi:uncharacterized protein YndB with AHSA1/START domain
MHDREPIVAKAALLIRRPAAEIFNAFTDPRTLTRFWLSAASGPLEVGKTVRLDFMVPGATAQTKVAALEPHKHIAIEWDDGTYVRWRFDSVEDGTVVRIDNWGFSGSQKEMIETAIESTQGFTIVLCDLKTLLETGRSTGLVRDKAAQIQRMQRV